MRKTEARVKKQKAVNKNTIIFPTKWKPRGLNVNALVKTHEHVLQHNTVLKELLLTNSFIVPNKRTKKKNSSCKIVKKFKYFGFLITDILNNPEHLSGNIIESF